MKHSARIICIGSELLAGKTLNSNARFLADALTRIGWRVVRETTVDDVADEIHSVLADALDAGDLAITIGGLGPTTDDMTRETVADHLHLDMQYDDAVYAHIAAIYERYGRNPGPPGKRMSQVPKGARVLPNPNGTAVGLWCTAPAGTVICLPGPPNELQLMFREHVLPELAASARAATSLSCTVYGTPESLIQQRVTPIMAAHPDATLAYRLEFGRCELRIANAPTAELATLQQKILSEFAPDAAPDDVPLNAHLLNLLGTRNLTMATAESCTGGLIAGKLTDVPGSSSAFLGSIVAYANDCKVKLLGVPPETLAAHGAVSAETAAAMARGATTATGADVAVSTTGIAGPGGGTDTKPVGLVHFATCVRGDVRTYQRIYNGTRDVVRSRAAATALNHLRRHLNDLIASP